MSATNSMHKCINRLSSKINDIMWTLNLQEQFTYMSPSAERIIGFTADELIKMTPKEILTHDSYHKMKLVLNNILEDEKNGIKNEFFNRLELEQVCKDGSTIWIEVTTSSVRDKEGNLKEIFGVSRNIQERKLAEEDLREKEERWRSIIKTSPDGIAITTLDGIVEEVSDVATSMYGYEDPNEIIGKNILSFFDESYHQKAKSNIGKMFAGTYKGPDEYLGIRKNGDHFFVDINGEILKDRNGIPNRFFFIERDISERKKQEAIRKIQYNIAYSIVTTKSLTQLLETVKTELSQIMDTTNIYAAIYNENSERFKTIFCFDEKDDIVEWNAVKSISKIVVSKSSPLLIKKQEIEQLEAEGTIELLGTIAECWLGVPIKSHEKTIGVVVVQSYTDPNAYNDECKELLEIVANQISIYISKKNDELELQISKEKAEESDRLKSAFLANMSHEIRTPLNSILGFASLLCEDDLENENVNDYAQIINKSGIRLLELINNIIEISKIESGVEIFNFVKICPATIIADTSSQFLMIAEKNLVKLNIDIASNLKNITIESDSLKLHQVLTNLINNALKFTKIGNVTIGLRLLDSNILFYVKDTGIGISKVHFNKIFDRFYQTETSITRSHEGSGLGLFLCKSIIEALKGKIWVESEVGKGSTFFFTLPICYDEQISN